MGQKHGEKQQFWVSLLDSWRPPPSLADFFQADLCNLNLVLEPIRCTPFLGNVDRLLKLIVSMSSDVQMSLNFHNTRFNTFQKRIPRVPRTFCSSLELKNFDQNPKGDSKRWSVHSKVCTQFYQ